MSKTPFQIVKFTAPCGWEPQFNDWVVRYCQSHRLVFVDRAAVLQRASTGEECTHMNITNIQDLPLSDYYAWFAHRGMPDLPFTATVPIPVELL